LATAQTQDFWQVRILSVKYPELEKKLQDYTKKLEEMVAKMNEDLKKYAIINKMEEGNGTEDQAL
jgi:phosphoribosylcarboxyaminoimidazole (NCAIR) mutase